MRTQVSFVKTGTKEVTSGADQGATLPPNPNAPATRDKFEKNDPMPRHLLARFDREKAFQERFEGRTCEATAKLVDSVQRRVAVATVLGSANLYFNYERTGAWIAAANSKSSHRQLRIESDFGEITKKFRCDLKWSKEPKKGNWYPTYFPRERVEIGGLTQDQQENTYYHGDLPTLLIVEAYRAASDRAGNCSSKCSLLVYYLLQLKSPLIKRIEFVNFKDLDHCFLVINRAPSSILKDSSSWGRDAIVSDPWLEDIGELRLYPADLVLESLSETREFMRRNAQHFAFNPLKFSHPVSHVSLDGKDGSVAYDTGNELPRVGKDEEPAPLVQGALPLESQFDIDPKLVPALPDLQELQLK